MFCDKLIQPFILVLPDGSPKSKKPRDATPASLLLEIHHLIQSGITETEAVRLFRQKLVPNGYQPSLS